MNRDIYVELGNAFKELRKKAQLSQKDIAERTGISQAEISKFENKGEEVRSVARINTLFECLGYELKLSEKNALEKKTKLTLRLPASTRPCRKRRSCLAVYGGRSNAPRC